MPRLSLLAVLVLLLAACGQPEEDHVVLDDEAAQALAQGAQRLASALEDEDGCAALAEADAVTSQARDGVTSGTVPSHVANEVDAVTSELTADLACEPGDLEDERDEDERDEDEPDEDEPDEDHERGSKERDRGNGPGGEGPDGQGPPGHAGGTGPGSAGGGG